jgi:Asp-tRNA(Asn)/Glu-tRNA(Gln) amidotransferase A subunit family amidase
LQHYFLLSEIDDYGVLTTTVSDHARLYDVLSGDDPYDKQSLPPPGFSYEAVIESFEVKGLRAAWSADLGYIPVEHEVIEICREATEDLATTAGLVLHDDAARFTRPSDWLQWYRAEMAEFKWHLEQSGFLPTNRDALSPQVLAHLERVHEARLEALFVGEQLKRQLDREVAEFFEEFDLLITPTVACRAFGAEAPNPNEIEGRDASETGAEPFSGLASLSWAPAISLPAGLTGEGLPVGVQIMAKRHRDHILLRLGRILEQARPWPRLAPSALL